jgi:hypothetical protein
MATGPGDLPIRLLSQHEFVVNLQTRYSSAVRRNDWLFEKDETGKGSNPLIRRKTP